MYVHPYEEEFVIGAVKARLKSITGKIAQAHRSWLEPDVIKLKREKEVLKNILYKYKNYE